MTLQSSHILRRNFRKLFFGKGFLCGQTDRLTHQRLT